MAKLKLLTREHHNMSSYQCGKKKLYAPISQALWHVEFILNCKTKRKFASFSIFLSFSYWKHISIHKAEMKRKKQTRVCKRCACVDVYVYDNNLWTTSNVCVCVVENTHTSNVIYMRHSKNEKKEHRAYSYICTKSFVCLVVFFHTSVVYMCIRDREGKTKSVIYCLWLVCMRVY